MSITVRSINFKLGDQIEDYATSKLERLYRYLPNIGDVYLELTQSSSRRGETTTTAQITLRHERGAILRAEERVEGDDPETLRAAVNLAVDKMYRQIERFKGKRHKHKGRERFSIATLDELDLAEEIPDDALSTHTIDGDEQEVQIVRRKQVDVMPMSELEAVEQMELLGHTFFIFFNPATGSVNVLYKRSDGGYGVLIPQPA